MKADPPGFGFYITIQNKAGETLTLGHVDPSSVSVRKDGVSAGQPLGMYYDGISGHSTGPHLHVELRGPDKEVLDPRPHLHAIMPAGFNIRSWVSPARPDPVGGQFVRPHNGVDVRGPILSR